MGFCLRLGQGKSEFTAYSPVSIRAGGIITEQVRCPPPTNNEPTFTHCNTEDKPK